MIDKIRLVFAMNNRDLKIKNLKKNTFMTSIRYSIMIIIYQ